MTQERGGNLLTLPVGPRDHVQGPLSAVVTLVEYGDYECSHSGQVYTVVKATLQRLGSRVRFVFRNFPISQIHARAQHAAEAAEAAGAQNRFWEMHDTLFEHQQALEHGYLLEYADALGLDTTRFLREMAQRLYADRVYEDFMSGMRSGVNGTPAFFINDMRHDDTWDAETLLAAVEAAAAPQKE